MSLDPHDLLRQLYVAGAEVSLTGTNTIRITGTSVPKRLIAQLREQKQEIIRILQEQGVGSNDDGFNSPLPRRYVVPPACLATRACARLGPCSQSLMRHGCVRVSDDRSGEAVSCLLTPADGDPQGMTAAQVPNRSAHSQRVPAI